MFGMMPGQNPFVEQFLKRRKEMAMKAAVEPPTTTKSGKKSLKPSLGALPEHEMDLATICSSKPKPKVVREYLEKRVGELAAEM